MRGDSIDGCIDFARARGHPRAEGVRCARAPRVSRVPRHVHADDDGRQRRARDQLLGHVSEVPLAGARRLRGRVALAAVSRVLGGRRRAQRSLRFAAPHPGRARCCSSSPRPGGATSSSPARLQMWHAMVLLVIHGCAGVLWITSSQMLLYDIVGPAALPSAVRLAATARYLGVLVGPGRRQRDHAHARADARHLPQHRFYLPLVLWLVAAPYGRHYRQDRPPPRRAVRGLADIVQTTRDVRRHPGARVDDGTGRRRVVLHRQQLPGPDAGLRARPRARRPGHRVHDAPRRRRHGRAARGHSPRESRRAVRDPALVGDHARDRVGRRALRIRADAVVPRSRSRSSSWRASSSCPSAAWRRRSCR